MRLVRCFEVRDGKSVREIAYKVSREWGGPLDVDSIPEGAVVTDHSAHGLLLEPDPPASADSPVG